MREPYVKAYAEYLRSKEVRAREELRPPRLPQAVQDMDLALPEQTILMFRCGYGGGAVGAGQPRPASHGRARSPKRPGTAGCDRAFWSCAVLVVPIDSLLWCGSWREGTLSLWGLKLYMT
jgi:hypothetical protein